MTSKEDAETLKQRSADRVIETDLIKIIEWNGFLSYYSCERSNGLKIV